MNSDYKPDIFLNFRIILKLILGHFFYAYKFVFNQKGNEKKLLFSNETDIVVEGFPRCGNTFFVIAFEELCTKKLNIAHHIHLTCQIKAALKNKKPVIILIRHPIDCILSLKIREPKISINVAMLWYYFFYMYVYTKRKKIYIKNFNSFTNDYSNIKIDEYSFYSVEMLEEDSVFKKIKEINNLDKKKNHDSIYTVSLPNNEKDKIKDKLKSDLFNNNYIEKKCIEIYNNLILEN